MRRTAMFRRKFNRLWLREIARVNIDIAGAPQDGELLRNQIELDKRSGFGWRASTEDKAA